jgi:hypothetical protein
MGQLAMGEPVYVRVTDTQGMADLELSWVDTFGNVPPGQALLYEDSFGRLTIAVNQGSAADLLGLREDAEVVITRAPLSSAGGYDLAVGPGVFDPSAGPGYFDPTASAPYDLAAPANGQGPAASAPYDLAAPANGQGPAEGLDPAWAMQPAPEPDPTAR